MNCFNDLHLFITIVQTGSFTKAGERLGVSKSALSQSMSNLEKRLNIRLLNRSTRSLSPTPEGLALYNDIAPHFSAIGLGLEKLVENQETARGTVRINASQLAIDTVILPKLCPLLADFPQLCVEIHSENRFVDIVAEGFDLGVRLGDTVSADMIAVRISEPLKTAVVATPQYLKGKAIPKNIQDLDNHRLIGTRLHSDRPPVAWDFVVNGKPFEYQPKTQIIINANPLQAVKNHLGLGFVEKSQVEHELKTGELTEVLAEFACEYAPFYAYYPGRKYHSKAFELVLGALRE